MAAKPFDDPSDCSTIQERVKVCELKIMKLESTLDDLVKPLERLKASVERMAEGLLRLKVGEQPFFIKEPP